jgi:hypothetical protein
MRKAHSTDATEMETHQPNASAANRALELLGRELNLFTEKKEVGKPGDFDRMADEELIRSIGHVTRGSCKKGTCLGWRDALLNAFEQLQSIPKLPCWRAVSGLSPSGAQSP